MRILVTGGTGVIGRAFVTALLQRGHVVQLLSRNAERDARQWSHGVHPITGNVAEAATIAGAADGCDAVVHISGIVGESGTQTFESVNVAGTQHMVREAERAGVRKFVYVSSLGAQTGRSPYHQSKRRGEAIVRQFSGAWVIARPGNVYGPGDDQISLLLRMVRTLPVLPTIGDGSQRFQPIWHEDLAEALAVAVERDDIANRELDLAGADITSQNDLVERLARITRRDVPRVPVPEVVARFTARVASTVGVDVPFNDSQMQMLSEECVIANGRENALTAVIGVTPTSLETGLRRLAEGQDEQLPDAGVGALRRRRYRADINGSAMNPEQLMTHVARHFPRVMTSLIGTQPETGSTAELAEGSTITLALPMRGNVQVRVEEVEPRVITLVTLNGHPLSGAVRLLSEARGDDLRFEVQVYDRASSVGDWLLMQTVGDRVSDAAWRDMVENVVRATGGAAPAGVVQDVEVLDQEKAEHIEDWVRGLVIERRRDEAGV